MRSCSEILKEISSRCRELAELAEELAEVTQPLDCTYQDRDSLCLTNNLSSVVSSTPTTVTGEHLIDVALEERRLKVLEHKTLRLDDHGLITVAKFIGSKYRLIRPLYNRIRASVGKERNETLSLKMESTDAASAITQLAYLTRDAGLLPRIEYRKSPQFLLTFKPPVAPPAINFFNGEWLEIYCFSVASSLLGDAAGSHIRRGARVILEHWSGCKESPFDFDIIGVIPGSAKIWWIEAKTSEVDSAPVDKLRRVRREYLDIPQDYAILANPLFSDTTEFARTSRSQASMAEMTAVGTDELAEYLRRLFMPQLA